MKRQPTCVHSGTPSSTGSDTYPHVSTHTQRPSKRRGNLTQIEQHIALKSSCTQRLWLHLLRLWLFSSLSLLVVEDVCELLSAQTACISSAGATVNWTGALLCVWKREVLPAWRFLRQGYTERHGGRARNKLTLFYVSLLQRTHSKSYLSYCRTPRASVGHCIHIWPRFAPQMWATAPQPISIQYSGLQIDQTHSVATDDLYCKHINLHFSLTLLYFFLLCHALAHLMCQFSSILNR